MTIKGFNSSILIRSCAANSHRSGRIKLATVNTEGHMNLVITEEGRYGNRTQNANITLHPDTAKALRDELLKAYPLEQKKEVQAPDYLRDFGSFVSHIYRTKPVDRSGGLKVGDKVRVTTTRFGLGQYGKEGVVFQNDRPGHLPIGVTFSNGDQNAYLASDLKVIPVDHDAGRFVVCLLEGGHYKPSDKPVIHYSEKKAQAEAERLAKKYGGTFHVLEAVFEADRPKVVVPPVKTRVL